MLGALLLACITFTFTSCGDDDEGGGSGGGSSKSVVRTGSATNVTFASATLNATWTGDISLATGGNYGFVYSDTEKNPEIGKGVVRNADNMADKAFSVNLTGLKASTTYYYRAWAKIDGEYVLADVKSFTTGKLDAELTTGKASEIGTFAASLYASWNAATSVTQGSEYGFLYAKNENDLQYSSFNTDNRKQASNLTAGTYSARVDMLMPSTTYYYRAYARTNGVTMYGDVQHFTTPAAKFIDGAVDLGLTVKWSSKNVGATNKSDRGGYFSWGGVNPSTSKSPNTYSWGTISDIEGTKLTKYNTDGRLGQVDNKTTLELNDDAAYRHMGSPWRMPTRSEAVHLLYDCSWKWDKQGGVNGYTVTGPTGNSIFLPTGGNALTAGIWNQNTEGCYWTSTLSSEDCRYGTMIYFTETYHSTRNNYYSTALRWTGNNIRAVCPY